MNEFPLVSIVMPCYNAEKFLIEAIESIVNQTYKNLEIVIIDDGSTDSTSEIIKGYAEKDPRIKSVKLPVNAGLINSLNKGIIVASGEYIARMDADDISVPERIDKMVKSFIKKKEADLICAANYMINIDGKIIMRKFPKATGMKALKFVALFLTPVVHGCVMAKSYVFKDNPFNPDYIHSEDYELFSRLIFKGIKMINLTEPLYYLRLNPESVSFRYESIQVSNHARISKQNIENYFDLSLEYFLLRVMINRISFNVNPSLVKNAFSHLESLKKIFIEREQCDNDDIGEIEIFLIEQKIDIILQSIKFSTIINKFLLFILMFAYLDLFISKRGFQYMKSKIYSKTKFK